MKHGPMIALLCVAVGGIAPAQVTIASPADLTTTDTCGGVPFGCLPSVPAGPGYSWMQSVPAALLDATHPEVLDLAFAPCASGGQFSALEIVMAIGHVPSPLPDPFVFPDPRTGVTGSFLDVTAFWDSAIDGPFLWTSAGEAWSPLFIASRGGTGFVWNGVDDVAVFISHELSATNPSFSFGGAMHGAPHDRSRASVGFLSPVSDLPLAADLKLRLTCIPAGSTLPRFDLSVTTGGAGDLAIAIANLPSGAVEGWLLPSDDVWSQAVGLAPPYGLAPSPLTFSVLLTWPVATSGHPFHWLATDPAAFPNVPLVLPPGTTTPLSGHVWDWMAVTVDASGLSGLSNAVRVAF